MKNSHIEWTDHTFNPWVGCTKVSAGCTNCYAESLNKRWKGGKNWGKGAPRERTSAANWREPLKWNRDAAGRGKETLECPSCEAPWKDCSCGFAQRRPRVFCASLADWLDDEVPIERLCNLLEVVHVCQNLDWLMLTKRPQNWQSRIEAVLKFAGVNEDRASRDTERHDDFYHWLNLWLNTHKAPANIWVGTSVENQTMADERIPLLLDIPARVRFLSCEPLLEKIDIWKPIKPTEDDYEEVDIRDDGSEPEDYEEACEVHCDWVNYGRELIRNPEHAEWELQREMFAKWHVLHRELHWVICGGESGPGARPMHPDWARSLRDQCQAAGVPFFFKQWGEYRAAENAFEGVKFAKIGMRKSQPCRQAEGSPLVLWNIGKKAAGRLLDGRTWDEFPKPGSSQ